jgi:hypothetical protein
MGKLIKTLFRCEWLNDKTYETCMVLADDKQDAERFLTAFYEGKQSITWLSTNVVDVTTMPQYHNETLLELTCCTLTGIASCSHSATQYQWRVQSLIEQWASSEWSTFKPC